MPWGYTVRYTLRRFFKLLTTLQGIFELENGGGLFGKNRSLSSHAAESLKHI